MLAALRPSPREKGVPLSRSRVTWLPPNPIFVLPSALSRPMTITSFEQLAERLPRARFSVLDWTSRPGQYPWQPKGDREPEAWALPHPPCAGGRPGVHQGGPPRSSRGTNSAERTFALTMPQVVFMDGGRIVERGGPEV